MDPGRRPVKGRVVEVDILEQRAGFVLSVGPVSLWLAPAAAIDVLDTLARAVKTEQTQESQLDAPSARAPRRRIFS
jgi:hypothetical protein